MTNTELKVVFYSDNKLKDICDKIMSLLKK